MREIEKVLSGKTNNKPVVFKLIKKNAKPALEGRYYPSQKRLPKEEIIFDSAKNKRRTIRYAPGESSIYKDEQPDKVVLGDVVFQNGSLVVDYTNPLLIEYLGKSNYNRSNPDRIRGSRIIFSELDPEADARGLINTEVDQIKAGNAVLQMPFNELKAYARVLGVNIGNGSDRITHDMLVLAKSDPAKFMSGIDDPLMKRQQVVLDAASFGIIEISGRSVNWILGDKKSLITPIPVGQKGVEWFSEWTMTDKDGDGVYKEIEKKVSALVKK